VSLRTDFHLRRHAALLLVIAFLIVAAAVPAAVLNPRSPAPSPDGSRIAFCHMGDIWVVDARGGRAQRLTVHEAYDSSPVWSPDGRLVAFSSDRRGNSDVYIVPASGGEPTRLTCHDSWDEVQCWTRDGEAVLFTSSRDTRDYELFSVAVSGGMPHRVIRDRANNAAVSPDGRWIAYARGRTPWWRKHYRGSASRDIWVRASEGGSSALLVDWPGDDDSPMWGADGATLYFTSERDDGEANIWRITLDMPSSGESRMPGVLSGPERITTHSDDGVQFARMSDDGSLIVYEYDAGLWALDVPGGEPRQVAIEAPSDDKWNDELRMALGSGLQDYALSPDESEIALVVRGEVFVCPFDDGEIGDAMRVTETPAREKDVAWLDDESLLFSSDGAGNYDIFVARSTEEGEPRLSKALARSVEPLTDSKEDEFGSLVSPDGGTIAYYVADKELWTMGADGDGKQRLLPDAEILHVAWSPDSRWISYSRTTMGHKEDVFIVPAAGGEPRNVTLHPNDDFQPQWSDDGRRLSFASRTDEGQYMLKYVWLRRDDYWRTDDEREEDREAFEEADPESLDLIVEIDFDGLHDRAHTIMTMRGFYDFYAATPSGHYYVFRSGSLGRDNLWLVDWRGNKLTQVSEGGSDPTELSWSEDGSTCYYIDGGRLRTVSIDAADGAVTGRATLGFSVPMTVDVFAERRQMFNEAWRLLLNGFYDPEMHGVDWAAVRARYEPLAEAAYTEEEFRTVVREMLGELSASHLGIYKWGGGGVNTGRLGIRHDESYGGPGVLVSHVIQDSPADRAGIEKGQYILSIDGKLIGPGENHHCLLTDTVGTEVLVEVADSPRGRSSSIVRVRPLSGGAMWRLVYEEWLRDNRSRVDEASGGRLGYLHIPSMGSGSLLEFEEDLFARGLGKDGLIIDIRGNGGGSIHDAVLRYLDRTQYGYETTRTRPPAYNPLELWDRPLVLLIDESCYSDAEIFPMGWKALDLGPVVGTPTFGAVIGTNDVQLIDGTGFRVPGSGWYDMSGRNLENWGIEPDVRVDSVPEEAASGGDVQLDRAVEVLMDVVEGRR
jgi:tricorn protease